tara:strand:- start:19910 stop:20356 length:447 start_codon:yes stop_codon:yes gene_type:complete
MIGKQDWTSIEIDKRDFKDLIKGLDRIKDKFSQKKANSEINKIVFNAAKPMTAVAKALAPVGETKNLKKSIGRWRTKTGVRVGARYRKKDKIKGWYVAFPSYMHKTRDGGMTEKATPFLADAWESTKELTAKLIIDGVNKLISTFWRS